MPTLRTSDRNSVYETDHPIETSVAWLYCWTKGLGGIDVVANSPKHAVEMVDEAFTRGDLEAVLRFYEDGAVVVTQPGKLARGQAELRAFFEKAMSGGSAAKQLTTYIIEVGDVALFTSRWSLVTASGNSADAARTFIATTVLRKQPDGVWKALIDNAFGPLVLGPE